MFTQGLFCFKMTFGSVQVQVVGDNVTRIGLCEGGGFSTSNRIGQERDKDVSPVEFSEPHGRIDFSLKIPNQTTKLSIA